MRRKSWWFGGAVLAAVVAASIAIASDKPKVGVNAVSATFSATNVTHADTRTCTGPDGTYELTRATYAGTAASSEPSLAGPIELKVRSVFNTTKKLGRLDGELKVRGSSGRTFAKVSAVNTNGSLDGFVVGEPGSKGGTMLGSLTASFSRTGGFAAGVIGSGTSANAAVIAGREPCVGKPIVSVKLSVRGAITALGATSISVKPDDGSPVQTCTIVGGSPKTDKLKTGDHVKMECALQGGSLVLVKVEKTED